MKVFLNGMDWDESVDYNFAIPKSNFIDTNGTSDPVGSALFIFSKNLATIVHNMMYCFEGNPLSLGKVITVLNGFSVSDARMTDVIEVYNFGKACKKLKSLITTKKFEFSENIALKLNEIVGSALDSECFLRFEPVKIYGCDYLPPDPDSLENISSRGFEYLKSLEDVKLKAIATFLFMSRNKFFISANNQTAWLMMNGILMSNGYVPVIILENKREQFMKELCKFYESGDATEVMLFLSRHIHEQYIIDEEGKRKKIEVLNQ